MHMRSCYHDPRINMTFIHQVEPWLSGKERGLLGRYLSKGGWITEYKETEALEKKIREFLGVRYAVMTTSGTAALMLGLMALGIKRGDKVIVPNLTMIATANAVRILGATPVFADIESSSLCIDVRALRIPKGTKALIHVSLNGRAGNIEAVKAFCKKHRLHFLEDACQAFSSKHKGKHLGTFGELGCYSLSPHKIITTGQGGIVVTNKRSLYERVKRLKDFGRLTGGTDIHEALGYNFKFTDLQAVFGIGQFVTIRERVRRKKTLFARYHALLKNVKEIEFVRTNLRDTTPWCIDVFVPPRTRAPLMQYLKKRGIGTRPLYPALTSQPVYRKAANARLSISKEMSARGLWLPSSCSLTEREVRKVCNAIRDFFHA